MVLHQHRFLSLGVLVFVKIHLALNVARHILLLSFYRDISETTESLPLLKKLLYLKMFVSAVRGQGCTRLNSQVLSITSISLYITLLLPSWLYFFQANPNYQGGLTHCSFTISFVFKHTMVWHDSSHHQVIFGPCPFYYLVSLREPQMKPIEKERKRKSRKKERASPLLSW